MMTFPSYISYYFKIIICVTLICEIFYLTIPDTRTPDRLYAALIKLAVCLTAIISYFNDKEKMLVISNKGLLIEPMVMDENYTKEKFSFIYLLLVIIYNPILPLFYESDYWVITHIITILFFVYKVWFYKRQLKK